MNPIVSVAAILILAGIIYTVLYACLWLVGRADEDEQP